MMLWYAVIKDLEDSKKLVTIVHLNKNISADTFQVLSQAPEAAHREIRSPLHTSYIKYEDWWCIMKEDMPWNSPSWISWLSEMWPSGELCAVKLRLGRGDFFQQILHSNLLDFWFNVSARRGRRRCFLWCKIWIRTLRTHGSKLSEVCSWNEFLRRETLSSADVGYHMVYTGNILKLHYRRGAHSTPYICNDCSRKHLEKG